MDPPDYSLALYLFHTGLLITSLVLPPAPWRPLLWLVVVGTIPLIFFTTTRQPIADYFLGEILVGGILLSSDYMVLNTPQVKFRQIGQKEPIHTAPFIRRLGWSLRLWLSPRCIGWTHEPKGVFRDSVPTSTTRLQFILSKLRKVAVYVLILDLGSIYTRANPSFHQGGPPLASRPWPFRLLDPLSFAILTRTHMSLAQSLMSITFVALGISNPQDWKPMFGHWSDAYTIRRFWGRVWHQMLRRMLSVHGKYLARDVFGFNSGTNLSSYTQLFAAFALSGLIHSVGDCQLHQKLGLAYTGSPFFFVSQFFGIMVEDFCIWAGKRAGLDKRWNGWHYFGYMTTLFWFVYTWSRWMDVMVAGNYIILGLNLPVSVTMGAIRGEWVQPQHAWYHYGSNFGT